MSLRKGDWQSRIKEIAQFPILGRKPQSEKEEKFMREICTYEFYNLEEPGLSHTFGYAAGKQNVTITLEHGKAYELPRFIAEHLESNSIPIYDFRPDGTGRLAKKYVGKNPRFRLTLKLEYKG